MISLIGNELKKVFKKKTIYILLIIIVGYILLANIMIRVTDTGYQNYYYYEGDLEYYERYLSALDPDSNADKTEYIDTKCQIELLKLIKEYGNNSWQAYVINDMLRSNISTMVAHEYSDEITEEAYTEAKANYDAALEKLNSDDWKYFVNQDLEEINQSLNTQYQLKEVTKDSQTLSSINDMIYDLELQKQVNEWRLEKDISYAPSFLNSALSDRKSVV